MMRIALVAAVAVLLGGGCARPPAEVPQATLNPAASGLAPRPPAPEQPETKAEAKPPAEGEVPIDTAKSSFKFEGYGPGKSHLGAFSRMEGTLTFKDGKLVAAQGTIDPTSVDTGIQRLNGHLQTPDFFDVAAYPEIKMRSTRIEPSDDGVTITGELTFHGVTHEVSFPAKVEGSTVSADFRLDTTPFGMKHAGVNKEVRIQFELAP